jgi:phospholipid/cholesterol/gamma-HCH transport system substrate-binding protein
MAKPFKFRYVNELVGTFVLLVLALLVAGIMIAGRAQGWFEQRHILYVKFPPAGAEGIQKGAEVRILGTLVGSVEDIMVSDNGSMEGRLVVKGRFIRFVRKDSEAVLKKKFQIAGDAYIEITRGHSAEPMPDGAYMPCRKDTELTELAMDLVDKLREETLPLLEQIKLAVEEYTGLAADMRAPTGHVQQILAHIDAVMAGVERGEGAAGKLLRDPQTAEEINQVVLTANSIVEQIQRILVDVKQITVQLPETTRKTEAVLDDIKQVTGTLPETAEQTRAMLYESQKLIEGIQRHWLLRKYIEQTPDMPRISPAEVTGSGGLP